MPMDRSRYPANWKEIALAVKTAANWTCQECGKPCRRPDESTEELSNRLMELDDTIGSSWLADLLVDHIDRSTGYWGMTPMPQRFTLTVAHLDHQPENCDRANLKALCSVCHLRYDATHHAASRRRNKEERSGQLTIDPLPKLPKNPGNCPV